MINIPRRSVGPTRRALCAGLAAVLISSPAAAFGPTTSNVAVVDNVTMYLAVLPAEMLQSYPPGSEDSRMHGGVPDAKHVHHVQIALFGDAQTYGGYFAFRKRDLYQIKIRAALPDNGRALEKAFEHRHP